MFTAAGATLLAAPALKTDYQAERAVRVSVSSSVTMETTKSEMERDGETTTGGGGARTETARKEVHVDRWIAAADGAPTKVRRSFVEIGGTTQFEMGENSGEREIESSFEGVTLELVAGEDGAVEVEVVEGSEPEGEGALEGHKLGLFLDAFLPQGEPAEGATWDLASEACVRGLRLDLQGKLFAPPPREEGGEGGGRRGGMRGGRGGPTFLSGSEWKGEAKLADLSAEKDGVACALIELKLETSGEREVEARAGRRGQLLAAPLANTMSWTAKLEGKLWFDTKARRPLALELEGTLRQETNMEMERQGSTMRMHTVQEGSMQYEIEVAEEPFAAEAGAKKD
jgi:hypothetical protein